MNNETFQQYVLEKLDKIADEVSLLKGKSIAWGAIGGFVFAGVMNLLVTLFKEKQ